jgi:hypothetical protein
MSKADARRRTKAGRGSVISRTAPMPPGTDDVLRDAWFIAWDWPFNHIYVEDFRFSADIPCLKGAP